MESSPNTLFVLHFEELYELLKNMKLDFFFVSVCDCLKISSSSLSTLSVYWALGTLRTINQAVNNIQRGQFCHCQPRVMALALIAPKGAAEDIIHIRQNAGLVYNVQIWLIHL